jgi:DNA invertase Pin-like site-specific DNA recombinase
MAKHINVSAPRGARTRGERRRLKVTPKLEATIHRLKAAGQSITSIAKKTGLSRPTIYDVLGDAPTSAGRPATPESSDSPWCDQRL